MAARASWEWKFGGTKDGAKKPVVKIQRQLIYLKFFEEDPGHHRLCIMKSLQLTTAHGLMVSGF